VHKRAAIIAATRHTFGADSFALRIRAGHDHSTADIDHVWARLRARLPGFRFVAVRESGPDAHLHALCTHVNIAHLRHSALAAGATDIDVQLCRDRAAYLDYLLDKRQDRIAVRITHSRDLTVPIQEPKRAETPEEERTRLWKARTPYPSPDFAAARAGEVPLAQAQAQAQETEAAQAAQASRPGSQGPGLQPSPAAPSLPAAGTERQVALDALIEAARATARSIGTALTITITVTP
jgi:hypothetical protein